jgi:hypothetical protein
MNPFRPLSGLATTAGAVLPHHGLQATSRYLATRGSGSRYGGILPQREPAERNAVRAFRTLTFPRPDDYGP